MKRGLAFTPDGPLTLSDLRAIALDRTFDAAGDGRRVVEIRTPMAGDRRQVTLTVTNEIYEPPPATDDTDTTTDIEGTD